MSIAIQSDHLSVRYNLSANRADSLKEYLIRLVRGKLFYEEFWALKDISFSLEKGRVLGVIDHNGAGKSTLLKTLAGVLFPTKGAICIEGTVAPLIELGAGFDPDLTGRENVYLNGAILGYTKKFLDSRYDEIVAFSELGDFMDVPVKNYSSGMYARLGFSIATLVEPDVLLVDEILSVGDLDFQQKCAGKIQALLSRGTTIVIVSHSIETIKELCTDVLWLEHGIIKQYGGPAEVCGRYLEEGTGSCG